MYTGSGGMLTGLSDQMCHAQVSGGGVYPGVVGGMKRRRGWDGLSITRFMPSSSLKLTVEQQPFTNHILGGSNPHGRYNPHGLAVPIIDVTRLGGVSSN